VLQIKRSANGTGLDLRCSSACDGIAPGTDCEVETCDEPYKYNFSAYNQTTLPVEPYGMYFNETTAVHVQSSGRRRTCTDGFLPAVSCDCVGATGCDADAGIEVGCCEAAPVADFLHLGHLDALNGGAISVFSIGAAGPVFDYLLTDVFSNTARENNSQVRSYQLAALRPGDAESPILVSSGNSLYLSSYYLTSPSAVSSRRDVVPGRELSIEVLSGIANLRDLKRVPGGLNTSAAGHDVVLLLTDSPSSLLAYDSEAVLDDRLTSALWQTEVCPNPAGIELVPNIFGAAGANTDPYLVVRCFDSDALQIYRLSDGRFVREVRTGRGPAAIQFDQGSMTACTGPTDCSLSGESCNSSGVCVRDNPRLFVSHYLENTIGVMDLDAADIDSFNLSYKIGIPVDLTGVTQ